MNPDVFAGGIIVKFVLLQILAIVMVLFVLKRVLERELFGLALERVSAVSFFVEDGFTEIVVLSAGKIAARNEALLRSVLTGRFPRASIVFLQDASLGGGFVIQAGPCILDYSLLTRIKQLFTVPAA